MASKSTKNKVDLTLKLMLVFCLALLSFAVGTFVGKNITEQELSQTHYYQQKRKTASQTHAQDIITNSEVDELANQFIEAERDVASSDHHEGYEDGQTEDTSNMKAEDTDQSEIDIDKVEQEDSPREEAKVQDSPAVMKEAAKVAQNEEPLTTAQADTRKPSNILPSLADSLGKYTVQVASYAKESEAAEHTAQLKKKGYTSFYSDATVKNQKWFRVSIGVFGKANQASKYKRQLLKKGHFSSALVRKIVQ